MRFSRFLLCLTSCCLIAQPAVAARYTPVDLCALTLTNAPTYESLTLPVAVAAEYPSGSVQSISIAVGDTKNPGAPTANGDTEFVVIAIDTDNDGTPDSLVDDSCQFVGGGNPPPGCTVTQNVTIPTVTEDTTFGARVMLSWSDAGPANACGTNDWGDFEDIEIVADVQEFITFTTASAPEDNGAITVTATLSTNVSDGNGLAAFTVDYATADGSATLADNDYTAATGTLNFSGAAGSTDTFTITPTADTVFEGDETILVNLLNLSNTTHGIDISDVGTVTIQGDDVPVDLAIAKSVDNMAPNIGSTVVFTLQVSNAGPYPAVDATVDDIVPAGFSAVTALTSPGGSTFGVTGNTINWTGINIPVGGSVTATFSAVVLAP